LIYVKCPLEVCEERDVKGMYAKARLGEIQNFTGASAPFEEPKNQMLLLKQINIILETCVNQILEEPDA